jgi:RNA polymerase sigma-70 factor (ECF subfamily)
MDLATAIPLPGFMPVTRPRPQPDSASPVVEDLDSAALRAAAAGDGDMFRGLVERWQDHLINFFYRSTGNRADAEDLAQETFLDLFRAAGRYRDGGTFKALLFTLARRRLIDSYRRRSRRPLQLVDPTDHFMQTQSADTDHRPEIEEAFHRALATLPDKQRDAILLRQQQELAYEEIAEAMGGSVSAVKTWIHRARQHLREELKDYA